MEKPKKITPLNNEEREYIPKLLKDDKASNEIKYAARLRLTGYSRHRIGQELNRSGNTIACWLMPSRAKANRDHVQKWKEEDRDRYLKTSRADWERHGDRRNANRRQSYKANPQPVLKRNAAWREANPELNREICLESNRKYRDANPEKDKEYYKQNTEIYITNAAARRARKMECTPPLTKAEQRANRAIYAEKTRLNKIYPENSYHVDHIIPLEIFGPHHPFNLRIITREHNLGRRNAWFNPEDLNDSENPKELYSLWLNGKGDYKGAKKLPEDVFESLPKPSF